MNTYTTTLRTFVSLLAITAVLFIAVPAAGALTKGEIDAGAKATLTRFQTDVKGGAEYLKAARGVLIMPHITKAGLSSAGSSARALFRSKEKTSSTIALFRARSGTRSAPSSTIWS